jgi:hypothetical protein
MKAISIRLTAALIVLSFGRAAEVSGQETPAPTNVFQQSVAGLSLNNQDIIDGVAMLSHNVGLAVSVEHELGATTSGAAPQPNTFTAAIGPGTVSEILDGLCALDPTFAWQKDGNMVNMMPRALVSERDYFLNRNVNELVFRDIRDAQEALFKTVGGLPPPKEQVAIMEVGVSLAFARPWSATFQNISIREALDQIARQLGPTFGWQLTGAKNFRIITFHQQLMPKPSRSEQGPTTVKK